MSGDVLGLVLAAVGIILSAVAIPQAYGLYRRAKKERQPIYTFIGHIVVRSDEERDIEVRHRGREVPLVARTVVVFWNAGREPIRRDDLVENHPLMVKLPKDTMLLDTRVVATTKPEIDFEHIDDERDAGVNLGFSFLNEGDGGAIEILHISDNPLAVEVEGAIVGVDGPPRPLEAPQEPRILKVLDRLFMYGVLGSLLLIVVVFESTDNPPIASFFPLVVFFSLFFGVATLRDRLARPITVLSRIPKALRESLGWVSPS